MKNKFIIYILLLIGLFYPSKLVFADSASLVISPSVIKVTAKPGANLTFSFNLENKGDPVLIKLQILPFAPVDNLGHVELGKELKEALTFTVKEVPTAFKEPFLLKSNSQQQLSFSLALPADLSEKDYYYSLLATTTPFPADEGETTLQFAGTVGAHILLTVTANGKIEQKATISLLTVPPPSFSFFRNSAFDSWEKVPITLIVKNNGRNVIKPQVSLLVKGWNRVKKYSLQTQNILAGSQRLIIDPSSCKDNCNDVFSVLFDDFFIGKYSVTASVTTYPGLSPISATTTFTAIPFRLFGIIVLIVLIFIFLRQKLREKE